MEIINREGKIFGMNLVDFILGASILFFVVAIACFYYKAVITHYDIEPDFYAVNFKCPNCLRGAKIDLSQGEPYPKNHEAICPLCWNKVIINRPELTPELGYQEQYYRFLLNKEKQDNKSSINAPLPPSSRFTSDTQ